MFLNVIYAHFMIGYVAQLSGHHQPIVYVRKEAWKMPDIVDYGYFNEMLQLAIHRGDTAGSGVSLFYGNLNR